MSELVWGVVWFLVLEGSVWVLEVFILYWLGWGVVGCGLREVVEWIGYYGIGFCSGRVFE